MAVNHEQSKSALKFLSTRTLSEMLRTAMSVFTSVMYSSWIDPRSRLGVYIQRASLGLTRSITCSCMFPCMT